MQKKYFASSFIQSIFLRSGAFGGCKLYGGAGRRHALSITIFSQKKSSVQTPHRICTSAMLPCARGAISRALRLDALRSISRPCARRFSRAIYTQISTPPLVTNSSISVGRARVPRRNLSTTLAQQQEPVSEELASVLPVCCPGCGAFSQTIEPNEPGYYSLGRKQTRQLLVSKKDAVERENKDIEAAIHAATRVEDTHQQDATFEVPSPPKPTQGRSIISRT